MKFGVCCGVEYAELVKRVGFDYFELGFAAWAQLPEEEFEAGKAKIEELQFYPEAMNGMLPGDFRLTGPEADLAPVKAFLEKGFARAAAVGTKVVVFGSGGARRVPDDFHDQKAVYDQLEEYLLMASDCAEPYGINIAIEPLSFKECNILNTVSEAAYLAARVNRPNVRVLADYFHVAQNREDTESIVGFAHRMEHCHMAHPVTRKIMTPDDGADYTPFFSALKKAGYENRVSFEGGFDWKDNPEEGLTVALNLMKDCASR